ncbi:unnamed protein product, partial [Allacma fusca]
MKHFWGP